MKSDVNTLSGWTHPIVVTDIPEEGQNIALAPDEETRAALARFADVIAIPVLSAHLHLQSDGSGGAVLTGTLDATVRQNCIVTLEPFDNKVHEDIALGFAAEGDVPAKSDLDIEMEESDPSDSIKNGIIDLGAVISEFLVLGIDPYPRKPGAVFEPLVAAPDPEEHPFAALRALKVDAEPTGKKKPKKP